MDFLANNWDYIVPVLTFALGAAAPQIPIPVLKQFFDLIGKLIKKDKPTGKKR